MAEIERGFGIPCNVLAGGKGIYLRWEAPFYL